MADGFQAPVVTDQHDEEEVPEGYAPEGWESDREYLEYARETYEADLAYDKKNRDMALEDLEFVAGQIWDPLVENARKGRPIVTINTLPQFIGQVIGDRRMNKTSIKLRPMKDATAEMAQTRAAIIKGIEHRSRADRVYDAALEAQISCGIGNMRVNLDWAEDDVFDQDIFIRPIGNPLAVVWDRFSIDPTGRDASRCFVQDKVDDKSFEREWPDKSPDQALVTELGLAGTGWFEQNCVRICEFWEMVFRKKQLALAPNGNVIDITGKGMPELQEMAQQQKLYIDQQTGQPRMREAQCPYARMHLITGTDILSGPYELPINRLPIVRVEGRIVPVGDDRYRYGLIRWMKDPIRMKCYWRATAVEKLAMAPRAYWLAEDSAVEGYEEDFRNSHTSTDPLLKYKQGQKEPRRVDPPPIDAAVLQQSQMNTDDMKDVSGIHDASLGIRSNETSGVAIQGRQREGDVATVMYHDNLNAGIQEIGDIVDQLLPVCYDTTRTLLAIGPDDKDKIVTVNDANDPESIDLSRGKYSIAVETGPSFTTQRQEGAQAMMEMIKVAPDIMGLAADLIAKYQDFPGAIEIAERLKQAMRAKGLLNEEGEQNQPMTPQMMEQIKQQAVEEFMQSVQGQTLQVELKTKLAEAKEAEANAEKAEHEAELAELEVDERAAMMPIKIQNEGKPDQPARSGKSNRSGNRRGKPAKKGNNQ